jgi:hypothetical protein
MRRRARFFGNLAASLLFVMSASARMAYAQADQASGQAAPPSANRTATSPNPTSSAAPSANTATGGSIAPSTNRVESSLYYWLNMAGRTQAQFRPLTPGEKVKFYAKGLFGPVMFFSAAASAGVTQWMDVPPSWGQGAQGFGTRFGNYFAKNAVQRTLRLGGEELLHEDNRYFQSGEHGVGRRIVYALKSSVTARGNDGRQHISISEIGSLAGSSFISRLWQPATNNSAGDGATSFAIAMGVNAGTDVLREFLPDLTRWVFRRSQGSVAGTAASNQTQP